MVKYELENLFKSGSIHKDLVIDYGYYYGAEFVVQGTITNENIYKEEFSLEESICSETELKFGSCESSKVQFKISNSFEQLKNKYLRIKIVLDRNYDNPFDIGVYVVESDVVSGDKNWRNITAYDKMYKLINEDCTFWYNDYWRMKKEQGIGAVSLKEFRKDFCELLCGINQTNVSLPNDGISLSQYAFAEKLSGKDILSAIGEINGCFPHINRKGQMEYIFLKKPSDSGLFPSNKLFPNKELYPREIPASMIKKQYYKTCEFEDFVTKTIDKIQISLDEEDIGSIYPNTESLDSDNVYKITNNFLVSGKNEYELQEIISNMYKAVSHVSYRPFSINCVGNPCLEAGDYVNVYSKNMCVVSYILQRKLNGIQTIKDSYSADGVENYKEYGNNSVASQLIGLKNRTNKLTRTSEENRLEIQETKKDLEENYYTSQETKSAISQTANSIKTEIASSSKAYATDDMDIDVYGYGPPDLSLYPPSKYHNMVYFDQSSGRMYLSDSRRWIPTRTVPTLESSVSTRIEQTEEKIAISVSENGEVTTSLTTDKNGMTFKGNSLVIKTKNFSLDESGNAAFSGRLSAPEGNIGNWKIDEAGMIADDKYAYFSVKTPNSQATFYGGKLIFGETDPFSHIPQTGQQYLDLSNSGIFSAIDGQRFFDVDFGKKKIVLGGHAETNKDFWANGELHAQHANMNTSTNAPVLTFGDDSIVLRSTSSSKRYKKDVKKELSEELNPQKLYKLDIVQYKFKKGYLDKKDRRYEKDVVGFIAEDVAAKYPIAVDYKKNKKGDFEVEDWNYRYMIPAMLKLIQEQKEEIERLKDSVSILFQKEGIKDE